MLFLKEWGGRQPSPPYLGFLEWHFLLEGLIANFVSSRLFPKDNVVEACRISRCYKRSFADGTIPQRCGMKNSLETSSLVLPESRDLQVYFLKNKIKLACLIPKLQIFFGRGVKVTKILVITNLESWRHHSYPDDNYLSIFFITPF